MNFLFQNRQNSSVFVSVSLDSQYMSQEHGINLLIKWSPAHVYVKTYRSFSVADPRFSKWGGTVLSQMGGAHILFSGKKCMKLKEIGLKWGGAHVF